jgi:hypothetical protein
MSCTLLDISLFIVLSAIVYAPVISYMSEWFVQRRGLATGILVAGTVSRSTHNSDVVS